MSLFGEAPREPDGPRPAGFSPELVGVAERLTEQVRLGTSSWAFPGWAGLVYAEAESPGTLSSQGLRAYAQHPLLRAVGVDRGFYAPVPEPALREYASQVSTDFRFLLKAHQALTRPVLDDGPSRYFLDASYARDVVVGPALEAMHERLGVVLFQFSPMSARQIKDLGGVERFTERVGAFLAMVNAPGRVAVEVRSPELLTPRWRVMLARCGAAHGYVLHPAMPPPARQAAMLAPEEDHPERVLAREQGQVVARWMLHAAEQYEHARERYAPFTAIVDDDPGSRGACVDLLLAAIESRVRIMTIINNKAEGSAPLSVFGLARLAAARLGAR
jgi:uncharacterized protein YecE (DUF72 family)